MEMYLMAVCNVNSHPHHLQNKMKTDNLKVLGAFLLIAGISTYQVLGQPKRPGHDLASVEKPEALRGDSKRDLATEKKILAKETK